MNLGIMQPYFMPYIGYFQLIKAVDKYVIYDDVNYIKGGWINRNNLLIGGEKRMFTITLKGASPNKLINEIEIGDSFQKLLKTLQTNYSKTPYFRQTMELMEQIILFPDRQLANFIANSLSQVTEYLGINTEFIISSQLPKNISLKGKDKVIHICQLLQANSYFNAIGGQELYDKKEFLENGIELHFLKPVLSPYPQVSTEFVPGLSMIDVLMNNSKEEINSMLDAYTLV